MTKTEMVAILDSVEVPAREGEQYLDDLETFPKIAYWEYYWTDDMASGDDYQTIVTYQVSFVSDVPRDTKLLSLKSALNNVGQHPTIMHEYVKASSGPGYYHSYFSVDVTEEM